MANNSPLDPQAAAQSRNYDEDTKKAKAAAEDGYRIALRAGSGASDDQTNTYLADLMRRQGQESATEREKVKQGMKQLGQEIEFGSGLSPDQEARAAEAIATRVVPLQEAYRAAHQRAMELAGNHTARAKYIALMDDLAQQLFELDAQPDFDI
jgi:hypothetical protein